MVQDKIKYHSNRIFNTKILTYHMPKSDILNCHKSRLTAGKQFWFAPGIFRPFHATFWGPKSKEVEIFFPPNYFSQFYSTWNWNSKKEISNKSSIGFFFHCLKNVDNLPKMLKNWKLSKCLKINDFWPSKAHISFVFQWNSMKPFGAVKRDLNKSACNTLVELKNFIITLFKELPREQVKLACARFRPRLEKVVKVEAAYFK